MSDQKINDLIEFSELWWNGAEEGEPIAQDEIELVKEITALAKSQQKLIDQQAKEIEFWKDEAATHAQYYLDESNRLELAVKALEDIKYQIQQSDHPAGLGILTSLNYTLEEIKRLGEVVNK